MGTAPSSQQGTLRREKKEAPELRESYLRDNIDDVIAIAAPSVEKLQQQAHNYAETISSLLSRLLSNDIEGESYNVISRCLENEGEDEYAITSTLDENAAVFCQWLYSRVARTDGHQQRRSGQCILTSWHCLHLLLDVLGGCLLALVMYCRYDAFCPL
ncbi:hypothetical protein BX667DRAFT_495628 [Coemansia mojavensis]|nr:hypothetical protein BX667DRAFT_495628 [Coemansia mojavensis]